MKIVPISLLAVGVVFLAMTLGQIDFSNKTTIHIGDQKVVSMYKNVYKINSAKIAER